MNKNLLKLFSLILFLSIMLIHRSYCINNINNVKQRQLKDDYSIFNQLITSTYNYNSNEDDADNNSIMGANKIKEPPGFTCTDKEDESYHEHLDCRKYWHCLYVGTIFQSALERRCPIGTMFHPIYKKCEISTMVS
jgi:hypothetical protein